MGYSRKYDSMRKAKGMALMELLVAMIIVLLLAFIYFKVAWKDSKGVGEKTQKTLARYNIKVDKSQSMVQSAEDTVTKYNKKTEDSQRQLENNSE